MSECNLTIGQTCPHIEDLEEEVRVVKESWREMKRLRDGDNELVFALAEDAGIKITADPLMPGLVWEQFHAGVMDMKRRLDRVTVHADVGAENRKETDR